MAACIYHKHVVIINPQTVKIYGPFNLPHESAVLRQTLRFPRFMWNVTLRMQRPWCDVSVGLNEERLVITASTKHTVYHYRLLHLIPTDTFELNLLDELGAQWTHTSVMSISPVGNCVLWSYYIKQRLEAPYRLVAHTWQSEVTETAFVRPMGDDMPALWPPAHVDFDHTLGLFVVGNVFGELAIYDVFERNHDALDPVWGALEDPVEDEREGHFSPIVSPVCVSSHSHTKLNLHN